jgi:hypothetical protein
MSGGKAGLWKSYTVSAAAEYWMDARAAAGQELGVGTESKIFKLSGHAQTPRVSPLVWLGYEYRPSMSPTTVLKCGKKHCTWRAYSPTKTPGPVVPTPIGKMMLYSASGVGRFASRFPGEGSTVGVTAIGRDSI